MVVKKNGGIRKMDRSSIIAKELLDPNKAKEILNPNKAKEILYSNKAKYILNSSKV